MISDEFKERLLKEGIEPDNVVKFTTENNKKTRKIITTVTLIDGTERKIIDGFVWYAVRKNKRW